MSDAEYRAWTVAGCTWVYDCTANPICGFDCTVFIGECDEVVFPVVSRINL